MIFSFIIVDLFGKVTSDDYRKRMEKSTQILEKGNDTIAKTEQAVADLELGMIDTAGVLTGQTGQIKRQIEGVLYNLFKLIDDQ